MKKKHLSFKFALVGLLITVFGVLSISAFYLFYQHTQSLPQLPNFFQQNKVIFLCWRLGLIALLFFSWPFFIRYRAKKREWPVKNISKAIALRYGVVVFLLAMDVFFQWSAVGAN